MLCAAIAMIKPLFIKDGDVLDDDERRVATIIGISTPEELARLRPEDGQPQNIVLDLLDWQVRFYPLDSFRTCFGICSLVICNIQY